MAPLELNLLNIEQVKNEVWRTKDGTEKVLNNVSIKNELTADQISYRLRSSE